MMMLCYKTLELNIFFSVHIWAHKLMHIWSMLGAPMRVGAMFEGLFGRALPQILATKCQDWGPGLSRGIPKLKKSFSLVLPKKSSASLP